MGCPHQEISIGSTCYTAGGVRLAFTQEDFLVLILVYSDRDNENMTFDINLSMVLVLQQYCSLVITIYFINISCYPYG